MEELYDDIRKQLRDQVAALKYIDSDEGQIDYYENFMIPSWPAALIDVNSIQWENRPMTGQDGEVEIQVRVAFRLADPTSSLTTNITAAKTRLAILRSVDNALNNFQGTGAVYTPLFRVSTFREKRNDALKVFRMTYKTWLQEDQV